MISETAMDDRATPDTDQIDLPYPNSDTTASVSPTIPAQYYPSSELDNGFATLETIPEGEPLTTFTLEPRSEDCDTGSYDSNTPLIGDEVGTTNEEDMHKPESFAHVGVYEHNCESDSHGNAPTYQNKSHPEFLFASLNRLMIDMPDLEIEEITPGGEDFVATPLRIIGSGWEFGSICSIPLQSMDGVSLSGTGVRSRSNTLERRTFIGSQASIFAENRLLSRVILRSLAGSKMSIGSKFSRNFDKEVYTSATDVQVPIETAKQHTRVATRNMKNLIVISIAIMAQHVAIYGLRNLQSSLNSEGGLGVLSLALTYGTFLLGSLISQLIVLRFTPKRCIVASCVGNIIYVLSNIYPSIYTLVPSSAIFGLANAIMWNSVCTYITEIGINESRQKVQRGDSIQSKFFGILFVAIQFAMVLGNLLSSLILIQSNSTEPINIENGQKNITVEGIAFLSGHQHDNITANETDNVISHLGCGVDFVTGIPTAGSAGSVDENPKFILLFTYTGFAVVATILIQLMLDPLPEAVQVSASLGDVKRQAGRILKMAVDPQFIFCVTLCIYTSSGNGFVIADVLKAYVTCPLEIYMVGYTMICFGLCGSISSFIFGKITPLIGQTCTFVIAAVINMASLACMYNWRTSEGDIYYIFALLGAWGFSDGIWQSQINSLISTTFAERYETAFGCCRVLQGFGGIVVFIMSDIVGMKTKLLFTGATCLLSILGYVAMEIKYKRTTKDVATIVLDIEPKVSPHPAKQAEV